MLRANRRRIASIIMLASGGGALAAFGCKLNLPDVGSDAGVSTDGQAATDGGLAADGDAKAPPSTDSASNADAPITVDAGACTTDQDCKTAAAPGGACVTSATCDKTWHVCMFDVCGNSAGCQAEICQPSMTCTLPATINTFTPASFTVSYGGVIPQGPQVAIAAVWPFVFIATNNGVVGYNVVDPTNGSPPVVPIHGVPFIAQTVVAVGRRVYFVRGTEGAGPVFRQAVAWVDVPQNPFLTSLQASSAWVSTPDSPLAGSLTNGADGLYFLYGGAPLEPTVNAHPPFTDTTTLTPYPNANLPNAAGIVTATGTRVISYRYDGALQLPFFAFVNQAGTSMVQTGAEQPFNAWGKLDNQYTFATGGDGSVLWGTAVLDEPDTGGTDGVASARLSWLVDSATAGNFDGTQYVDLATYSPPSGGQLVGQPAWIDATTALGFAAPSSVSTDNTLVQIVKKGAKMGTIQTISNGSPILPYAPASIGVASSNGFAYALEVSDPKNQTCRVQIFAPSCAGTD